MRIEFLPLGCGKATPASESFTSDQRAWTTQRTHGEQQRETFFKYLCSPSQQKDVTWVDPTPHPSTLQLDFKLEGTHKDLSVELQPCITLRLRSPEDLLGC